MHRAVLCHYTKDSQEPGSEMKVDEAGVQYQ